MMNRKKIIRPLIIVLAAAIAGGIWWYFGSRGAQESNQLLLYGNIDIREADLAFNNSEHIDKLLHEVVDSHRHLLESNNVAVEITIRSAPVLPVECALLRIVVGNLIRNAFSYTTEGCVRITLDSYSISVADTGVGIPAQQLEEVFKPFYSAQGGEGIGLSLVRRICQHYGWQIKVSSRVGKGTRFRLDFSDSGDTHQRA
jgi:signal transduction histidine kinase